MSIVTVLLALAGLAILAWIGVNLYDYLVHDGYGRPRGTQRPPNPYRF